MFGVGMGSSMINDPQQHGAFIVSQLRDVAHLAGTVSNRPDPEAKFLAGWFEPNASQLLVLCVCTGAHQHSVRLFDRVDW